VRGFPRRRNSVASGKNARVVGAESFDNQAQMLCFGGVLASYPVRTARLKGIQACALHGIPSTMAGMALQWALAFNRLVRDGLGIA